MCDNATRLQTKRKQNIRECVCVCVWLKSWNNNKTFLHICTHEKRNAKRATGNENKKKKKKKKKKKEKQ